MINLSQDESKREAGCISNMLFALYESVNCRGRLQKLASQMPLTGTSIIDNHCT